MTVQELEKDLQALKERLASEKTQMAFLKDQNEDLASKLYAATQTPPQTSPQPQRPSPTRSSVSTTVVPTIELVYIPKDKKGARFSGHAGTMTYYEWVDDVQNLVNFCRYKPREQAAYLYDHLDGEAQQEIKHCSEEVRKDPERLLETLKEAYGHPCSLTQAQKRFFDRRQREGESLREYSHALLSLAELINRCNHGIELCGEQAAGSQFAENVRDPALRRELKKIIRQDPTIKFLALRQEAILFSEEDVFRGKAAYTCAASTLGAESAHVVSNPDPLLCKLREAMRKQEEKLDSLTKRLEQMQGERGQRRPRQEPRYDPSGRTICFRCQQVGHIARFCTGVFQRPNPSKSASYAPVRAVAGQDQQGNFLPL